MKRPKPDILSAPPTSSRFSLSAPATQGGVRDLLLRCREKLIAARVPEDWLGHVELVFAEALNNVVEHAYGEGHTGEVGIAMIVENGEISAHIRDSGLPLPGLTLPPGALPELEGAIEALPEGGFGWFLIRSLCETVEYHRVDGQNHLSLVLCSPENTP